MPRPTCPNIFQRLIHQWDRIHPYNAAQVMRLTGTPDVRQLDQAWVEMVRDLGVGPTPVIAKRYLNDTELHPGSAGVKHSSATVTQLDASTTTLTDHLSAELNRPFDESGASPFRPFVLPDADGKSFYAGVVYQHAVADSVSVRLLLREWFLRVFERDRARRIPLLRAGGGYWRRFGPGVSNWNLLDGLFGGMRWAARMKRARRIERRDFSHPATRFELHRLPPGIVPKLLGYARSQHVTLNDVFLAAIARVCDQHVAAAPTARRHDLAVGTIVDLRRSSGPQTTRDDEFGLFLGFTSVLCRYRELRSWPALLESIARQNARQKQARTAEASMIRMTGALIAGRWMSPDNLLNWYRKRLPLCAGISNINLNRTWVGQPLARPVLEYVRVSPVGPIMPIVFTPSTLGDDLNFGMTHRESVIPPTLASVIAQAFARQLIELAGSESG